MNVKKRKNPIIRVAIAGQGRSGYGIHAHWLKQVPNQYRIVAVADQLPERRGEAEREFGAASYSDYADMIRAGGFDLFVNALPTQLHVAGTLAALDAGCHVVAEKPLAPTVREVDRMARAAARAGRILAPFQNNRLQPFFDMLQEILRSGVLGEILSIRSIWSGFARRWDWQTLQRNFGGTLFNTGPHAVDQALALIGWDKQPEVFCRMTCRNRLGGDAEDFCTVTLYGPGLPTVEILISQYLAYPQGDMYNIQGTLGGLSGHATELKWRYYDPRKAPRQVFWKPWSLDRRYPHEELPWVEKTWKIDDALTKRSTGYTLRSFGIGNQRFYDSVYNAIVNGGELLITVPQVRRQVAILEECHRQNPQVWRRFGRT